MTEHQEAQKEAFTLDELASMAWAVDHLIHEHGHEAIISRSGSRVRLDELHEKILRRAAALGLTAGQEGEGDE